MTWLLPCMPICILDTQFPAFGLLLEMTDRELLIVNCQCRFREAGSYFNRRERRGWTAEDAEYLRITWWKIGVFNCQLSIFNFQFSIFNFQFSIFNSQFSILNFQFSIFNSQFSIFNSNFQFSIFNCQLSIFNSNCQFSILIVNFQF